MAAQEADAEDRANQRPAGRPKKTLNNIDDDVKGFPAGNSRAAALRRLRKDRPDIQRDRARNGARRHDVASWRAFRRAGG
jgi:hypothetical protein